MNKIKRKLVLNRETIKLLSGSDMQRAMGGLITGDDGSLTGGSGGTIGTYQCGTLVCTTVAIGGCGGGGGGGTGTCSTGHD